MNAIVGENGIIKQAQKASTKADLAKFLEDAEMAYTDVYSEKTQERSVCGIEISTLDVVGKLIDEYRVC